MALRSREYNASQCRTKSEIYRGQLSRLIYITLIFVAHLYFCINFTSDSCRTRPKISEIFSLLHLSRVERASHRHVPHPCPSAPATTLYLFTHSFSVSSFLAPSYHLPLYLAATSSDVGSARATSALTFVARFVEHING